ncbi:hypothetical protein G6F57_020453 [Rhizopus arrhizus]|nr:hypothetical protein G6F57_020453 [Rhizopus arrhizus]
MALSLNIWAPTGKYNASDMANPSLNNWTFIPQVAYTKIFPESGFQLDTVAGVQFYTRNSATDYRNAPVFSLDVMGRKTSNWEATKARRPTGSTASRGVTGHWGRSGPMTRNWRTSAHCR